MEALTTEFLMQTATNFPFLGWMIYQYHAQQQVNKAQREEMREIRQESKREEKELRERYAKVIADLQTDRDQLVKDLSKKTDSLERSIKRIFAILEPIKEQVQEMQIKEKVRAQVKHESA
jgi:flagellar biosynthesis GTPase FlhF